MEFIDLKTPYQKDKDKILQGITRVLDHGQYILGPEVAALEGKLAEYVGRKHCISCANGTDALLMALMALGVGPGDAVFTTTFTFIATAEVISLVGATPVFVDIDETTYNIDPIKLAQTIEMVYANDQSHPSANKKIKPKAIITVDLFGLPADYDAIESIASQYGLALVEDGAQSMGAEYKKRKAGSFGAIATTSFFPAKPLGCYGDGGALFTDDDELAHTLQSIRVHGKGTDKYDNQRIGINGRLDTIQAAILIAKWDSFLAETERKQDIAKFYSEKLAGEYIVPFVPDGMRSAWAQYSIRAGKRADVMNHLKEKCIPTAVYYPKPLHLQGAFKSLGYQGGDFSVAEKIASEIFSLPMHAYLTGDEQEYICKALVSKAQG